ncbi:hypothetical protein FQN50_009628 [Emmonsiellopsis sp. PD_5]|nr:hypothetical protein FQN50_009628 [Emmonsiellopsis sp. PD_5]
MPPRIAGYASVNYRLTAHPNFPQDPTTTGPMNLRNATHPDHLIDVKTAIRYLQDKYGFGQRYILVGHSCGATLAFQTVMGKVTSSNPMSTDESFGPSIEPPFAIVGVEGIYDIRALRDTFKQYPIYHEFIGAAFGDQEDIWDGSSPARVFGQAGIEGGWKHGRLAILAHSMDDELVDIGQLHTMAKTLKAWETSGTQEGNHRVLFLDDLKGGHDEIWSQGSELARVIAKAIDELKVMEAFN